MALFRVISSYAWGVAGGGDGEVANSRLVAVNGPAKAPGAAAGRVASEAREWAVVADARDQAGEDKAVAVDGVVVGTDSLS